MMSGEPPGGNDPFAAEAARLEAVRRLGAIDVAPVDGLAALVEGVALACDAPIAWASVVDATRHWALASTGTPLPAADADRGLVATLMGRPGIVAVQDAAADPELASSRAVADGGLRFFGSTALVSSDGFVIGLLAVADTRPRALAEGGRDALALGSHAIVELLERHAAAGGRGAGRARDGVAPEPRDALTGLPHRKRIVASIEAWLAAADPFAVAVVDVDALKVLNDAYGYATGDAILREVATRLRNVVRADDVVVRIGGDDFAIALRNLATRDDAAAFVDRVFAALAPRAVFERAEHRIAANVGLTIVGDRARPAERILADAARALDRGRVRGGGGFAFV